MKKPIVIKRVALFTALGLMVAGWVIAEDKDNQSQGGSQTQYGSTSGQGSSETKKFNKCSELIGMDVQNPQGEKLGAIKDVVIDFTGDRVSYVVLSADAGALTTAKLHAVPLRAFQPSADGKNLTLNADKQKLASAQGFTDANWPSPSQPAWGAQPFWQEPGMGNRSSTNRYHRDQLPGSRPTTPGTTPR
jgi:sporulation protein YlmC with PRC-barrel domain